MQGLLCPWAAEVEQDRGAAIAHAIDCAHVNDVILVAGKGHEDYQIIGSERLPFSDVQAVKEILSLPIYPELNRRGIIYICREIKNFFRQNR